MDYISLHVGHIILLEQARYCSGHVIWILTNFLFICRKFQLPSGRFSSRAQHRLLHDTNVHSQPPDCFTILGLFLAQCQLSTSPNFLRSSLGSNNHYPEFCCECVTSPRFLHQGHRHLDDDMSGVCICGPDWVLSCQCTES